MMLVEEGKIGLDDSITKYFHDAPPKWKPVTVRHLLSHTGGFTDYPKDFNFRKDYTEDELFKVIAALPLDFLPGTKWSYSNLGYATLARMSHRGGGERRKAAGSADGGSSTSGNHRTDLPRRACSPSAPRVFRFFVRARHTTARLGVLPHSSAAPSLSAAQSCDLQLPVHLAEQLQVRIAGRQRHPDFAYGDANLGPDLEQL